MCDEFFLVGNPDGESPRRQTVRRSEQAPKQDPKPLPRRQPVRPQSHRPQTRPHKLHKREFNQSRPRESALHSHTGSPNQHDQPLLADGVGAGEQSRPNVK